MIFSVICIFLYGLWPSIWFILVTNSSLTIFTRDATEPTVPPTTRRYAVSFTCLRSSCGLLTWPSFLFGSGFYLKSLKVSPMLSITVILNSETLMSLLSRPMQTSVVVNIPHLFDSCHFLIADIYLLYLFKKILYSYNHCSHFFDMFVWPWI